MFDDCKFETFLDAYSTEFQEYVSSIVAALSTKDPEYRTISDEIAELHDQYPKVFGVFDSEAAAALTEQECAALIKVLELRNRLLDIETRAVYLRGCYDSLGYLKKAGIL